MVRSPVMSPEMKKSKLDVYPDRKPIRPKQVNKEEVVKFVDALSGFEIPSQDQLVKRPNDKFRRHPNEMVEKYFSASALWGVPAISWKIVRPIFLWKLEFVISEFIGIENRRRESNPEEPKEAEKSAESTSKEKISILSAKVNLIKTTPVVFNTEESIEFIMEKAKSFDGFPFTWQRICELLEAPMVHYNRLDKFLRAFEKVINVVTTITQWGGRVTGEWQMDMDSSVPHLENVFFGPVDEVEAMDREKEVIYYDDQPLDMSVKSLRQKEESITKTEVSDCATDNEGSSDKSSEEQPKDSSSEFESEETAADMSKTSNEEKMEIDKSD